MRYLLLILFKLYVISNSLGQVSFVTIDISIESSFVRTKQSIIQTLKIRNTSDKYVYILLDSTKVLTASGTFRCTDTNFYQTHVGTIKALNFNRYPSQVLEYFILSPNDTVKIVSKLEAAEAKETIDIWDFNIDYVVSKSKKKKYTNSSYEKSMVRFSVYGMRLFLD